MMKKASMIAVLILVLFVVNVSAGPLNSFAENPIPYWNDLSNNVSISWDSTERTVTVSAYSIFWEDMSDISDWNSLNDPITTDGDIASITTSSDYVWDRWDCNTPDGLTDWEGFSLEIRWKSNVTEALKFAISIRAGDDYTGNMLYSQFYITPAVAGVWSVWEDTITRANSGNYECVSLLLRSNQNVQVDIDYINVFEIRNLNLGVPLILQDSQEIELYVNSTSLLSEVRLEIYDDTEALDTYCVFNSSYVVFPNDDYAQTDGLARIRFSLDNERGTGTITVFAENNTQINQYETSILPDTNYLRMNDSVFEGAIVLYYLNGDLSYTPELSIIEELFLSTGFVGYLGPLTLVFIGWLLVKKDKGLGVIAFIVQSLFIAQYLALVEATPDYWWHIFILIFGMLFTVVLPLWDR